MKEVRIEVIEDDTHYFGHALITVYDANCIEKTFKLLVSRKSTDTPYLGTGGWQASPVAMDVELVSRSESKVVLRAGPRICDRIPYSLYVRLQIEGSETFGQAFWPEIMQTPKGYSGTLEAVPVALPKSPDIVEVIDKPPDPPPFVPTLVLKDPEPVVENDELSAKRKRSYAWIYILLLLVTCGGGGLAYWKWGPPVRPVSSVVSEPTSSVPTETLSARFERLKVSDQDGDELLALSEDAFQDGNRSIFQQSIDLAVQRGNASAKITQAKWYDPRTFAGDRVQAVDANRSARAYFELALGGNGEARGLLTSLCEASRRGGGDYQNFFDSTYCQGSLDP